MPTANDRQEGGKHYQGAFQHWDYVLLCLWGRYLEGNITKYVCRYRRKNGLEDLRKAHHYAQKLMEEQLNGVVHAPPRLNEEKSEEVKRFIRENNLPQEEAFICHTLAHWSTRYELIAVNAMLGRLIRQLTLRETGADPEANGYVNQDTP